MVYKKIHIRLEFIISLLLVLFTLLTYWQLPSHGFVSLDDHAYITNNKHVMGGITWENIAWAFRDVEFAYWHPLTWLSHMLVSQIFGLNHSMHHLANLFLHIASTLLLFFALRRMTDSVWQCAFLAALFALHPLNVESVAWVSERKNVLSSFFWMLTLLMYASYTERPCLSRYLLTLFVYTLGLTAKPMLVTLPFVLLLLDYWPLSRIKWFPADRMVPGLDQSKSNGSGWSQVWRLILEKVPFLTLSAICVYISSSVVQHLGIVVSTDSVSLKLRVYNALVSYVSYLFKMVWPHKLAVFYPYPEAISIWEALGAVLFLACATIIVFQVIRTKPYLMVG